MAEWYWMKDGQKHGPADTAHLKQLARAGQLQPTDMIWRDGLPDWVTASKAKGLFEVAQVAMESGSPPPLPMSEHDQGVRVQNATAKSKDRFRPDWNDPLVAFVRTHKGLSALLAIVLFPLLPLLIFYPMYLFPVIHGLRSARAKGLSPHWMWFGVSPLGGWTAFAVMRWGVKRTPCGHCGNPIDPSAACCPRCGTSRLTQPAMTGAPCRVPEFAVPTDHRPPGSEFATGKAPPALQTSRPAAMGEQVRLWAGEGPFRRYLGFLLERHVARSTGSQQAIVAYVQGVQPPRGFARWLAFALLIPFMLPLAVLLVIPGWIFFVYRTIIEWRQAREAGVKVGAMIGFLVVIFLFGLCSGAALEICVISRILGLRQFFLARTETDLVLVFFPVPIWVPQLGVVEVCPVSKATVNVMAWRSKSAIVFVQFRTRRMKFKVPLALRMEVTGSSGRGRAVRDALAQNLEALLTRTEESAANNCDAQTSRGPIIE